MLNICLRVSRSHLWSEKRRSKTEKSIKRKTKSTQCHLRAEVQSRPSVLAGIFMSTCNVDVRWFPFDVQKCVLKFGSWTYDGWLLDLQMNEADISGYMPNGEWDLIGQPSTQVQVIASSSPPLYPRRDSDSLGVPGARNEVFYDCCKEPYPDVTFMVTIRRRTLYYALNLLIPCMLMSSMTLLIFVLPADSGEKISLGEKNK